MRLQSLSVLSLLSAAPALAADISFTLTTTPHFPDYNPAALPASTRATLFRHSQTIWQPVTRRNTFDFRNVSQGSYLFTVQCRDYNFGPLRVDVLPAPDAAAGQEQAKAGKAPRPSKEQVEVYQTFWGNEWGNKGEWRGGGVADATTWRSDELEFQAGKDMVDVQPVVVNVVPDRPKEYYSIRTGFSPLDFLKNPMILMALFSLTLIIVIPYLTENMDEETRAEFEEMQRKSPVSQVTSGGALQNFDLASWMAGRSSNMSSASAAAGAEDSSGR